MKLKIENKTKNTFHYEGWSFVPGTTITRDLTKVEADKLKKWLKLPNMEVRVEKGLISLEEVKETETPAPASTDEIGKLK